MIVLRKLFSKNKEREDVDKSLLKGGAALAGAAGLAGITTADEVTGKVTRYHNTLNENVDKILEEGIKSKYAEDPNNLTNRLLHDVDMEKKKGKVYLAKDRNVATAVGVKRGSNGIDFLNDYILRRHPDSKNLKLEFEYDDLKNNFKEVENPELRGLKKNDYKGLYEKMYPGREWKNANPLEKLEFKENIRGLTSGTQVIEGDIDSKYIVGGKNYKKRGIKEFGRYIKNHPGRFAKGVAKIGTAAALVGYGIKKGIDSYKGEKEFSDTSNEDLLNPEEEKTLNKYKYVLGAPYVQAMLDNAEKEYKETDEEFKNRYEDLRKSGIKKAAIVSPIVGAAGYHLSGKKGLLIGSVATPAAVLGMNSLGRKGLVERRKTVKEYLSSPEKMKELEKDKDLARVFLGQLSKRDYKSRWHKEKKEEK